MKRKVGILLALTLTVSLMAGCSQSQPSSAKESEPTVVTTAASLAPAKPVSIVLWHTLTDQHEQALKKIVDDYNKSQNIVTVVAQAQPYQDFEAKVMQGVRNGAGPDIISSFATDMSNYIAEDMLIDFAPYINDSTVGMPDFQNDMAPGRYEELTQWGESAIYGIPELTTGEVLFYNKTLFNELSLEVPKTWSDLEKVSRAIYKAKGIPGFGTDAVIDTYQCLIAQEGSSYIDGNAKAISFNNDIGLEKLNWFSGCIKEGIFRLVGQDTYFSNPFGSQAVGCYIGSSAGFSYVDSAVNGKFEFDCAPIPQEGSTKYISSWSPNYIGFKSTDEKAAAIYDFLKYFAQPDVAAQWCMDFGAVPAGKKALNTSAYQEYLNTNPALKALASEMDYIGYLPSIHGSTSVRTNIDKMIQLVCLSGADPKDALKQCETDSNKSLQQ